jgi:hypothetical protein
MVNNFPMDLDLEQSKGSWITSFAPVETMGIFYWQNLIDGMCKPKSQGLVQERHTELVTLSWYTSDAG